MRVEAKLKKDRKTKKLAKNRARSNSGNQSYRY